MVKTHHKSKFVHSKLNIMETILRLGIQKSGRLTKNSIDCLKTCGITIHNNDSDLSVMSSDFPLELIFLRDDDIPNYVSKGALDLGIIGENILFENLKSNLKIIYKLYFGRCRLSLAIPNSETYTGKGHFNGKKIATSHPSILNSYLKKEKISAEIYKVNGSVEVTHKLGVADIICDLVCTGKSLSSNNLKEVETIFESEAVLITNTSISDNKLKIIDELIARLASNWKSDEECYHFNY